MRYLFLRENVLWSTLDSIFQNHIGRLLMSARNISFYKITKIVRALWLAERSVCMRVCKHGCGVKLFAFRALITQARSFVKFKTRQVYFIYPFLRRLKLGKSLQRKCVNFFRLNWHFKRKKSVFWKTSFCKTRTDYACKTSWTRLCEW